MKTIKNEKTSMVIAENEPPVDRLELLSIVLNQPLARGMNMSEMRQRIKILDSIEASDKSELKLEDSDFSYMKKTFEEFNWLVPHKDLIKFSDHLETINK